ncbi:peptidase S66 [Sporocytophaga myxococcoides]|uniref:Peptidase S66 n=1 Tax=Sporocytophaga myxococcoides TaxID=153721 RepID=A0A098LMH1_9BACT|nr:LD-carboxypeptidase [Sporocytophaga myxococcoides]GAL87597.1 peptidase S66 [Sporocytophaga myxococcoides]
MKKPDFLKVGDIVGIVATAKNFLPEELNAGIEIIKSWGFEVRVGKNCNNHYNQFAGTDEERFSDLQDFLDDQEVKAIICARGGYGTSRIIDNISFSVFETHPKWIAGFSDVTVLLSHLNSLGFQSIHSSMPVVFGKNLNRPSINSLRDTLLGKLGPFHCPYHELNRMGYAEGEIVGGNLSILVSLIGTKSDISTQDKILFIEDVGENLYRIDRMMVQLKRAGKLDKLKGLIVGHFNDMSDNIVPFGKSAFEIIEDAVKEYEYPVGFNFPAGHEADNRAFILGAKYNLIVESKETVLTYNVNYSS